MVLDEIDKRILRALQDNAHITIKEIAAIANISLTPVHERIKKMEAEGIIERYVTLLNRRKLGKPMIVYCNITLHKQSLDDFESFNTIILEIPEIVECSIVSGAFDYILKIVVADMDDYFSLYQKKLSALKSVAQINSFFVMNEVKFTTSLPI